VSTFITVLDDGRGPQRVAVKDLIDVAGVPTTAGCLAVARRAGPAASDASCLTGLRAAVVAGDARIVGKTNLHEMAAGATGINPWFGTPRNPLDHRLVPGGSSSGSATAVGAGDADVALGTDTAGSVRIPAACCGIVGLKTTHGRIATAGVWPLAPSLDTVGPMARDVAGVIAGMAILEPGFRAASGIGATIGRVRLADDPRIEAAIDRCLRAAELVVTDVHLGRWAQAGDATLTVVVTEAWQVDGHLLAAKAPQAQPDGSSAAGSPAPAIHQPAPAQDDGVSPDLRLALHAGRAIPAGQVAAARRVLATWRQELAGLIDRHGPLVLPTLVDAPPTLAEGDPDGRLLLATAPVNGAGLPSLALPVPLRGRPPTSLQIVGRPNGEEELVTLGLRLEAAIATL
jgi:amidase